MKIKCTCKHEGQDKLHGEKIRIANPAKLDKIQKTVRCTVCNKEVSV